MDPALLARYREVNGDHPMTPEDDAYVREHFREASEAEIGLMLRGELPLPSYLLSDGTPMVPTDLLEPLEIAGGAEALPGWFASHWPVPEEAEQAWADYLSGQLVHLASVTPLSIRAEARWVSQAREGIRRLAARPRDPVARGLVGEATERLEVLYLPTCGHDRLRFGGPAPLETRVHDVRRRHLAPSAPVLPLRTERLTLRGFRADDGPGLYAYHRRPEVAALLLADPLTLREAEHTARDRVESIAPDRGGRYLSLVLEHEGELVGDVMLRLEGAAVTQGEIGWVLHPDHAGRGFATEAATALLDLAFGHYALHRVIANLDARNGRSAALCERLGMRRELDARADFWSKGEWTSSYTYAVLAEEWAARRRG